MNPLKLLVIAATLASASARADVEIVCRDSGSSNYYLGENRTDPRIIEASKAYRQQGLLANQTGHFLLRDTNPAPLLSGLNGTLKAQVSSSRVGFGDQVAIVVVP